MDKAKTLLLVCHQPSDNTRVLAQSALAAALEHTERARVEVRLALPKDVGPQDVLDADAILIGTTENLATMAGLTKDFFERVYYPVLELKQGLPVAVYIRAGLDGTGTTRQMHSFLTGLKWRQVAEPLVLHGAWRDSFSEEVADIAGGLAAGLEQGVF